MKVPHSDAGGVVFWAADIEVAGATEIGMGIDIDTSLRRRDEGRGG
jgi:hypothetical protein